MTIAHGHARSAKGATPCIAVEHFSGLPPARRPRASRCRATLAHRCAIHLRLPTFPCARPARSRLRSSRRGRSRTACRPRKTVCGSSIRAPAAKPIWSTTPTAACCDRSRPTRSAPAGLRSMARRCGLARPSVTKTCDAAPRPERSSSGVRRLAQSCTRWRAIRPSVAVRSQVVRLRRRVRRWQRRGETPLARLTQVPSNRLQGAHGQEWKDGRLWTTSTSARSIYEIEREVVGGAEDLPHARQPAARSRLRRRVPLARRFESCRVLQVRHEERRHRRKDSARRCRSGCARVDDLERNAVVLRRCRGRLQDEDLV